MALNDVEKIEKNVEKIEKIMKDECMFFLHEGIRLGRRRSDDLWRPRRRRAYAFGFLIGVAVGVLGYIEIASTIMAS